MKVAVNRPPKTIWATSKLVCIFCPNLVVLAWIDGELWHGQAQNVVNLAFQVKFDLEGQGQSPPKTIGTLTKLFCTFWPNLVVLAWTRGDLWRGQARGWRTHTQTDAGNNNTRRPKLASGKNGNYKYNCQCSAETNSRINPVYSYANGYLIIYICKYMDAHSVQYLLMPWC